MLRRQAAALVQRRATVSLLAAPRTPEAVEWTGRGRPLLDQPLAVVEPLRLEAGKLRGWAETLLLGRAMPLQGEPPMAKSRREALRMVAPQVWIPIRLPRVRLALVQARRIFVRGGPSSRSWALLQPFSSSAVGKRCYRESRIRRGRDGSQPPGVEQQRNGAAPWGHSLPNGRTRALRELYSVALPRPPSHLRQAFTRRRKCRRAPLGTDTNSKA